MCVCAVISSSFVYSSCAVCDSRRARPALSRVGLLPRKPQTAMHSVHGTLAGLRTRGRRAFSYRTSLPRCGTQCVVRLSFPLTAAGQSRIHTGFPLTTTQHHTEPNQLHVQYNQENSFGQLAGIPASRCGRRFLPPCRAMTAVSLGRNRPPALRPKTPRLKDRKSTRLNSSHVSISYAVFCL